MVGGWSLEGNAQNHPPTHLLGASWPRRDDYGITHRAQNCHNTSRCGIIASKKALATPGALVKCRHCTAMRWMMRCDCEACEQDRTETAAAFARGAPIAYNAIG